MKKNVLVVRLGIYRQQIDFISCIWIVTLAYYCEKNKLSMCEWFIHYSNIENLILLIEIKIQMIIISLTLMNNFAYTVLHIMFQIKKKLLPVS